jgi:adenine-specific DNA-methyltransferase
MKQKVYKFLLSYSTLPIEVDRLIVSSYLHINGLNVNNNVLLKDYIIFDRNTCEYESVVKFSSILMDEFNSFNLEDLIELFEFVISPSDRIINGAIYTPPEIRKYIVDQVFKRQTSQLTCAKIADISCGCSGFLFTAAKELKRITCNDYRNIFANQIFGLDIQEYSVTRSKLLLSLLALTEGEDIENFQFNIHHGDALAFKWEDYYYDFEGFQIIVGNPPYVCARNLDDSVKVNLRYWSVCNSGNPDLYIPFFQIGYENLAENGILGYITMNTFFKSLNGRALRSYFEDKRAAIRIIDFGTLQIFKSKSTYTCICLLENKEQSYVEYYRSIRKELPNAIKLYSRVNYKNLNAKKGWNLHNNQVISKIESVGTPFGERYKTRHGIATLRNDLYIFKPVAEDEDFFYLQNGNLYPIEKGICKDILNSNKLSRNIEFDQVREKVLFPYDGEKKPRALEEKFLKETFPKAYKYLRKKKDELSKRDKGKGKYEKWFAFGRTQSLEQVDNKLFFPKFSDQTPNYLISNDNDLMFYNGQAIVGHSNEEMLLIKKVLESRLFWHYIKTTSKPYSSRYFSLDGIYIKNFGIPEFSTTDIDFLINATDKNQTDAFFEDYYGVRLHDDIDY